MADKYTPASDVATIGKKLIKQHHDHLSGRRVEFLFIERLDKDGQSQAITRKGKSLYGQAKLVTGLNAYLACAPRAIEDPTPFFVILITKHFWTNASEEFKHALVDHELSHCWFDSETEKYSMIEHDVTEFTAIVKRHGLWNHDVEVFVKAAKQQSLAFDEETSQARLASHEEAESISERSARPPDQLAPAEVTLRTPKVRRIRGAKSKAQATEILGG
jgi:hypothetical protein